MDQAAGDELPRQQTATDRRQGKNSRGSRQLLAGPGMDEICPKLIKALDVVGLPWLTHLCNIMWTLGDCALGLADRCGGPPFQEGEKGGFQIPGRWIVASPSGGVLGVLFTSEEKMEP